MKFTLSKVVAAASLAAAAALVSVPMAASAAPLGYGGGPTASATTPTGIFAAGETVTVLLSGEDANYAVLGVVKAAYVSSANLGTVTSSSSGSASFSIQLPSTASGTYSTVLTSASRPQGYTVTIAADGSVTGGGASGSGSNGSGLPATGMDSASLLGLWVGGGALVLAGGAVAVGAAVHRQRKHADA